MTTKLTTETIAAILTEERSAKSALAKVANARASRYGQPAYAVMAPALQAAEDRYLAAVAAVKAMRKQHQRELDARFDREV